MSTSQHAPPQPLRNKLYVAVRSMWVQGVQSSYRKDYWRFLVRLFVTWRSEPVKIWLGFFLLCTGHHFVRYSRTVAAELDAELANELENTPAAPMSIAKPSSRCASESLRSRRLRAVLDLQPNRIQLGVERRSRGAS